MALGGKICPNGFRRTKPAIVGSNNGSAKASYIACWKRSQKIFERAANSTSVNASSTGCLSSLKRGLGVGKTKRGKGTKLMAVADGDGLPLAVHTTSASPHEVSLVTDTLLESFVDEFPERLIGDKAYDSDPLDEELATAGIEMIAPHRGNRKKPATQDGRPLRRYRRRYKVERLFAWLQNFRRLVVRYEYNQENFLGFVHLGCILILLRCYL